MNASFAAWLLFISLLPISKAKPGSSFNCSCSINDPLPVNINIQLSNEANGNEREEGCAHQLDRNTSMRSKVNTSMIMEVMLFKMKQLIEEERQLNKVARAHLESKLNHTMALLVKEQMKSKQSTLWIPVPSTHIGSISMNTLNSQTFHLPSAIPDDANEVLLFIDAECGGNPSYKNIIIKIFTVIGRVQYTKYIRMITWNQNAIYTNADNTWLPLGTNKIVHAQISTVFSSASHLAVYIRVIGYRTN